MEINLNVMIMNIMINLVKFIVFISIFLAITSFVGDELKNVAPPVNIYSQYKWEEYYGLKRNSLDMIYLGSSHAYRGFEANLIDSKLGTRSFNMGSPLQKPVESYYVLKELLRTQKPKMVVFDVFWNVFNDETYFGTKTCNFDLMKQSPIKMDYLFNVFDKEQYLPAAFYAVRYHERTYRYVELKQNYGWAYASSNFKKEYTRPRDYLGKGFVRSNKIMPSWYVKSMLTRKYAPKLREYNWDKKQWRYFKKIISLCEDKKIKLMLVTIPNSPTRIKAIDKFEYPYKPISEKIKRTARENGLTYIDYNLINQKKEFVKDADFSDDNHLNYSGVVKLTKLIVPSIKKEFYKK